jgi:hypothetical protein
MAAEVIASSRGKTGRQMPRAAGARSSRGQLLAGFIERDPFLTQKPVGGLGEVGCFSAAESSCSAHHTSNALMRIELDR